MPIHYMPDSPGAYVAVTTSHATLIRTAKQNSLTIAVSGTDHWIHNTTPCIGTKINKTTAPFGVDLMRSQVLYRAALGHALVCI